MHTVVAADIVVGAGTVAVVELLAVAAASLQELVASPWELAALTVEQTASSEAASPADVAGLHDMA